MGLAVKINIPAYSETEILQIKVLRRPFLKIQKFTDIWANANIDLKYIV